MSSTSPDYCIVKFTLLGVYYIYKGGSGKLLVIKGDDLGNKDLIEAMLARMPLHHIPADVQIKDALIASRYGESLPVITYTENQPQDTLPEGAIS